MDGMVSELPSQATTSATSFYSFQNDLVYVFLLLLSIFISFLVNKYASLNIRSRLDGLIGIAIVVLVCGRLVLCSLAIVIAHLILLRFVEDTKLLTNLSFFGTFAYLGLIRHQPFFELSPFTFVTMITLRAVGLAYEVADLRCAKKKNDGKTELQEPSTIEAFNYLYCFAGLFIGPYFSYQTYADSFAFPELIPISKLEPLLTARMRTFCWTLLGFVLLAVLDPVNAIRGLKIDDYNMLQLFIWTALAYLYLRMRAYSAWNVVESSCMFLGIGVYPRACNSQPGSGPMNRAPIRSVEFTDPTLSFDAVTISNFDIPTVEHCESFRRALRAWNRTVQWWMANFVYHRVGRSHRLLFTMIVSAWWHPHFGGYFLAFLSFPLLAYAEDLLFEAFPERPFWFRFVWSIIRMRSYELVMAGQLLLDGLDTLHLWWKMYFWTHLLMLGIIAALKAKMDSASTERN